MRSKGFWFCSDTIKYSERNVIADGSDGYWKYYSKAVYRNCSGGRKRGAEMKHKLLVAFAILGIFALLSVLAASVVSADDSDFTSLEASYDGTYVNVTGNVPNKYQVSVDVCNKNGMTLASGVVTYDESTGDFTSRIKVPLAENTGYQVQVTASDLGKKTVSATAYFDVVNVIEVHEVDLDWFSMDIRFNETGKLTAKIIPSNATDLEVVWSSSDPSIATVDQNGVVTGKSPGTAIITVAAAKGAKISTCTINVTGGPASTKVKGIYLSNTSLTLSAGSNNTTLVAMISPSDATNKVVTWRISDESVATISSNGLIKAIKAGTVLVSAMTNDGGYTAICTLTVKASADPGLYNVGLPAGPGFAISPTEGSVFLVQSGGSFSFKLALNKDYNKSSPVVKVNGATLNPIDGVYSISNITENKNISVEGVYSDSMLNDKASGSGSSNGVLKIALIAVALVIAIVVILELVYYYVIKGKKKK